MKPGDLITHNGRKLIAQIGPTGSGTGCSNCALVADKTCCYDCFPGAVKMILRDVGDPWIPFEEKDAEPEKNKQMMLF